MNTNNKTITDFFTADYPAYGAYDNIRKIASYIDGLKLSQRKVVYTMLNKFANPSTETKTGRLASAVAEATEYVHGEGSLAGVLNSMAASYTGANNFPLLTGHGNFGSRFSGNAGAAAPRYTYCSISPLMQKLFHDDDNVLCKSQIFEDTDIEPIFYMPLFPVIFLNGTEGLSSGWRTQIYPRNPKDIIAYMANTLAGKKTKDPNKFMPYFKGFKGVTETVQVRRLDDTVDEIFVNYGVIEQCNTTTLKITELPITYTHASYISFLNQLIDKSIIRDYENKSDPKSDTFEFIIKVERAFFKQYDEDSWLTVFGLAKNLNEHLNCIDADNRVVEFNNIKEILDAFIKVRLEYYELRRLHLIDTYKQQLKLDMSRYVWCKGIIDETIIIKNTRKDAIIQQIESIEHIIKHDNSYNYLLNMPLTSITFERMQSLQQNIDELIAKLKAMQETTNVEMMSNDIREILMPLFK